MAVEMAVQKLAQEANLIVKFREDFRWLKEELRSVRGLLEDADQQSRRNDGVKQWLENIRDIAMQSEDIFEECAVESIYGNDGQSCAFSFSQWYLRYKIGRRIRHIKVRIGYLTEKVNQLRLHRAVLEAADEALPSTSEIASVELKRSSLLPRDSHPVGIQSKVDHILSFLNDPAIPVIAVVGMGGIGKTYLIQHVFNVAKERYEKSIWLSVSQSYSVSNLQKDLVFQLKDEELGERISKNNEISEETLAQEIHERLERRRCLVALNDVWRAPAEADLLTKLGLPSGDNGHCKIVVTTRSKIVSTNLNAHVYEMPCMSDEDSRRLFFVYAFGRFEEALETNQQQLTEVGRMIVKECGNLPLAVKTIAASLANTRDVIKWELKLHQLVQVNVSAGEKDSIMGFLNLGYNALPTRLKACFAYLSFFPEDEKIDAEYMIKLWIGEGFIGGGEQQLGEAWDCLHQLASLCLLQLWEEPAIVSSSLKETMQRGDIYVLQWVNVIKYCKVHDLLLDLAIQISRENRSAFSGEEAFAITSDGTHACSRILLAKKDLGDIDVNAISERRPVCLHTLSQSQNKSIEKRIPEKLFSAMRGLRVLDLSGTSISTLPASVGKMKLLKVLNLRETNIREVPECVKHLKSLFFLALPGYCHRLPAWISEFTCLQHLECRGVKRMPKGISKVASLRTLRSGALTMTMTMSSALTMTMSMSSAEENEMMGFDDLAAMVQLQELWVELKGEMEIKRMGEVGIFAKLLRMRCLSLENSNILVRPHIPENMIPMKHLESVQLWRCAVPRWICGLENLRELELCGSDCNDYPELQRLSNLVLLRLGWDSKCRELPKAFGKSGGFPQLRFFTIHTFDELEEFPDLEEGAMACLEVLRITSCPKMKRVGEGLGQLKTLKELELICNCIEVREAFRQGGQYHNKIKANNAHLKIIIDD